MAANANALITIKELYLYLGLDENNSKLPDSRATEWINQASQIAEDLAGVKFIAPASAVDERFHGNGFDSYYVRQGRIEAGSTPAISYTTNGTTWTLCASPNFEVDFDRDEGRISFVNGRTFAVGRFNWKINYKYGWTDITAVDSKMRGLICRLVQRIFKAAENAEGMDSKVFADATTSFNLRDFVNSEIEAGFRSYQVSLY